jgi:Mrp family chromosome partitioning ATPase/capsular polysaccharide biosynthesis protein
VNSEAPTLRDYALILWRRRWIVILVAILAPVAAVAVSTRHTPAYRASSEVLLQNTNLAASLAGVNNTSSASTPAWLDQTQAALASVPAVAQGALSMARVKDMTAAQLLDHSSVTAASNSDLLRFTVTSGDPALARKLATDYARFYTIYRRKIDTGSISRLLGEAQSHLANLRASGDTHSTLYASLLNKVQTLQTLVALQTSNASVIRAAEAAPQVSPRPLRDGALGLVLGLILGIGLAFLRETLDTRVRSAQEISDGLALPLLARIPEPPKRLASKRQLAALAEPAGPAAESFRLLRTNLEFASLQHPVRSILVTSALQGEGKSTTAANLAVALAQAGRRTILVDLDLRAPSLHRFFDLDPSIGLTNVCLAERTIEQALRPVVVTSEGRWLANHHDVGQTWNGNGGAQSTETVPLLEVLATGPLPPDPGEFVGTPVVADLLGELVRRSQIVVIDAPPLLSVVDALTLSPRVDGLLIVANRTMLRRPLLREIHHRLDSVPVAKLGFVLAGAEAEEPYGYGVRYYGYGSTVETRAREPVA